MAQFVDSYVQLDQDEIEIYNHEWALRTGFISVDMGESCCVKNVWNYVLRQVIRVTWRQMHLKPRGAMDNND